MAEPELLITLDPAEEPSVPPPRRPMWRQAVAVILVFAAGIGAGYQAHQPQSERPAPEFDGVPIAATGSRCAVQTGTALWLGAQFANRSPDQVMVVDPQVWLPGGGLTVVTTARGPCGQTDAAPWAGSEVPLTAWPIDGNAEFWISALFDVTEPEQCPAPYPVIFSVSLPDANGQLTDIEAGFVDLGDVPYSACGPDQ